MQKVVGSSPIIRFGRVPRSKKFVRLDCGGEDAVTVAEPEPRKTGFYESCLADGGSFVSFRGRWLPADLLAELRGRFEVELENIIERLDILQVQGPLSRRVVGSVCGKEAAKLRFYRFLPEPIQVAGAQAWISRTGYSGEIGYEIFCAPEHGRAIWQAFRETGDVIPNGFRAIATVRVEAGLVSPLETPPGKRSPYEVSLDRFIGFDGREFRGRESLLRAREQDRHGLATLR